LNEQTFKSGLLNESSESHPKISIKYLNRESRQVVEMCRVISRACKMTIA